MRELTDHQRELARHALGLDGRRNQSYRNHYVVDSGPDHAAWMEMVQAGTARRRAGNPITGGMDLFRLTPEGARAALAPGERLCPEDFPAGRAALNEGGRDDR